MKKIIEAAEKRCQPMFARIDEIALENTAKVLDALQRHEVAARHFAPTTGYGYDDIGRDTLEKLFADLFHADAAIVRPQIASGTHALSMCLFGLLRPGDELLYASGGPYDTLEDVIGQASALLKENGRFYMVHRPFRLAEIMVMMSRYRLEPKRMKLVYPFVDKEPNMVLIEGLKGGRPRITVEKPLIVYEKPGVYTSEIYDIYGY